MSAPMDEGWTRTIRRRARTARWLLAGPAEWGLAFRAMVLSAVISSLKPVVSLATVARVVRRPRQPGPGWPERDEKALAWVRWIYGTGDGRCLDRSLVLAALLADTHADLQVVIGMRKASGQWSGHAWVLLDGQPFGEDPSALDEFDPMLVFTTRRTVERGPGPT